MSTTKTTKTTTRQYVAESRQDKVVLPWLFFAGPWLYKQTPTQQR